MSLKFTLDDGSKVIANIVPSGVPLDADTFVAAAYSGNTSRLLSLIDYLIKVFDNLLFAIVCGPIMLCANVLRYIWWFFLTLTPSGRAAFVLFTIGLTWYLVASSYQAYLDLGRGGTPSTLKGWFRVHRLKWFGINVLSPPSVPPMLEPYRGLLENIPARPGPRPIVKGIAPQRQTDQKAPRSTCNTLVQIMYDHADQHREIVRVEPSFLEGHLVALKAVSTKFTDANPITQEFGYEICHPHKNDGSLHMVMHPEDIKTVIESGWGERHPLSRRSWYWVAWYHYWKPFYYQCIGSNKKSRCPVPENLCLIYSPRNEEELAVIRELLRASIWWVTGVELGDRDLGVKRVKGATARRSDRRFTPPSSE